jgi:hypothetical protein
MAKHIEGRVAWKIATPPFFRFFVLLMTRTLGTFPTTRLEIAQSTEI